MTEQPTSTPTPSTPPSTPKEPDVEMITKNRSLYDVSMSEVFWRNFLTGFGRALGVIAVYLVFVAISGYFFVRFLLPTLAPLFDVYSKSMNSLGQFNKIVAPAASPTASPAGNSQPLDLLKPFKQ